MPASALATVEKLLRQHDLVYERAAGDWSDGLPLANGSMGAMIWGDGPALHFTLDHYGVWEQRFPWPGDDPSFSWAGLRRLKEEGRLDELAAIAYRRRRMEFSPEPPPIPTRLALGRLELEWPVPALDWSARLQLMRARASLDLGLPQGRAGVSAFVCSGRDVLIVDVRCREGACLPRAYLSPAPEDEYSALRFRLWHYPSPEIETQPGQQVLRRRYSVGKEYAIALEEERRPGRLTIMLTIVAGAEGSDTAGQALRQLADARRAGLAALRREHEDDWSRFWGRSAIVLPDSRLEGLYYAEMYKHYCSSRPGGPLPVTLQGLWTTDGAWPPWQGSYTVDCNVEESYWPIYASDHLESGEPLCDMYWRNLPQHRSMGQYWWGTPLPVITSEHGPGGESYIGYVSDEHMPSNGAWIAHHFWLHWLYSRDRRFLLERAYPFLREFLQPYLLMLEKRDDGRYHLPFTDSPELHCGRIDALGDDTTYDLALLRFLLGALIEAQPELPLPDPDLGRWKEVLANLTPFATGPTAAHRFALQALLPGDAEPDWRQRPCLQIRPGEPLPHSHRHHSHLIGIYPLGVIDPEAGTEQRALVEGSLQDLAFHGTGEWGGMSFPWASLIAGRAGHAWMAYHHLLAYLDGFVGANTFHTNFDYRVRGFTSHAGTKAMTLEAGFAAAAAIQEMLLQSHHGLIRLFPTCPPIWPDAQFRGMRAEGAFIVSARRVACRATFVEITSEAGARCRVRNPFGGDCWLQPKGGQGQCLTGDVIELDTQVGETYLLTPAGVAPEPLELDVPTRSPRERHWFGLKRRERF